VPAGAGGAGSAGYVPVGAGGAGSPVSQVNVPVAVGVPVMQVSSGVLSASEVSAENASTFPLPQKVSVNSPSGSTSASAGSAAAIKGIKQMYTERLSRLQYILITLLVLVLGLLGYIFYSVTNHSDSAGKIASAQKDAGKEKDLSGNAGDSSIHPVSVSHTPNIPQNSVSFPSADSSKTPNFVECCNAIRADLAQRNIPAVRESLAAAANFAATDLEKLELNRLTVITDLTERFLDELATEMGDFPEGGTMKINGNITSIFESDYGKLGIKQEGKRYKYQVHALPNAVVELLLKRMKTSDPSRNVRYGAYLVMGDEKDRKKAEKVWKQAVSQGQDVSLLMPELGVPLHTKVPTSALASVEPGMPIRRSPAELMEMDASETPPTHNGVPVADGETLSADTAQLSTNNVFPGTSGAIIPSSGTTVESIPSGASGNITGTITNPAGGSVSSGTAPVNSLAGTPSTPSGKIDPPSGPQAAAEPATTIDAKKREKFRDLMTDLRGDISARDIPSARQRIRQAQNMHQSEEELSELERLELLTDNMENFVQWVGDLMGSFNAPGEAVVNGEPIYIVDARPGYISAKMRGVVRRYTVDNLNPRLVAFLVKDSIKLTPDNRVLYGTYLAMDPEGDRAQARRLWEEAKRLGFDSSYLMPELSVPLPGQTPGRKSQASVPEPQRYSVPSEAEQKAALEKLKTGFSKLYSRASDAKGKDALVTQLAKHAEKKSLSAAERYVTLEETVKYAQESYRFLRAFNTLQDIQRFYETETYERRMNLITSADPEVRGTPSVGEVAGIAIRMGKEAAFHGKKEDAKKMYDLAKPLVERGAKPSLKKDLKDLEKMMEE
ncbi:MAG: hypothetical protein Q4C96_04320, partial [Planctomycetia bacterium]|nr:hypothetical protein [Planctomycetia bacterium]